MVNIEIVAVCKWRNVEINLKIGTKKYVICSRKEVVVVCFVWFGCFSIHNYYR